MLLSEVQVWLKFLFPFGFSLKLQKSLSLQTLKKVSFSGGGLAYAGSGLAYTGGNKAYSFIRNKLDNTFNQNIHEEEINSEGAEISFSQSDKDFKEDENYTEPEDFSINEREEAPRIENRNQNEENLSLEEKTHQDISTEQTINQENNVTQENNISKENNNEITKDFNKEDSPKL